MLPTLLDGLIAGFAIAVPVGAIATLIVLLSAQHGWRTGAAAGLGTASVDGLYAVVAVSLGAVIAPALVAIETPLRWASAAVLAVIGLLLLRGAWRTPPASDDPAPRLSPGAAYLRVFALTAVNPATVVYFAALVTGSGATALDSFASRAVWVAGVVLASAAWQTILATTGATLGRVLTGRAAQRWTSVVGGVIVMLLAVRAALGG